MGEEIQEYQRKWHNHVEIIPPERLSQQSICLSRPRRWWTKFLYSLNGSWLNPWIGRGRRRRRRRRRRYSRFSNIQQSILVRNLCFYPVLPFEIYGLYMKLLLQTVGGNRNSGFLSLSANPHKYVPLFHS
jgi:hypothetical protein